jgi:DNA-binding Lrp family transcriptional regulator
MSAPAVSERVQRLERAGVIAGYRLDIDPAAVGLPVTAFARIRPMPGSLPKIAELAASVPKRPSATESQATIASSSNCKPRRSTSSRPFSTASSPMATPPPR